MTVDYHVDLIAEDRINGWAWSPDRIHEVLTVEMVTDRGAPIADTIADAFRIDLATVDKRAGWCAFSLPIPDDCPEGEYRLRVRSEHETVEIAGPFLLLDRAA